MSREGLVPRLLDVVTLAVRAHHGQVRKGALAEPYVLHPIEVARMVTEAGADDDTILAALLHDVVEDSDTTTDDIARDFGRAVAELVAEVTDDPTIEGLPRPERKARQAQHIARASRPAKQIKIADQTSNIEDLTRMPDAAPPEGHESYRQGALRVVDACRRACPPLEAPFDAAIGAHRKAAP